MFSLDPHYLKDQYFDISFAGLLQQLGRYKGRQDLFKKQTPQTLETLRYSAMIQSTESSNRIEGVVVTPQRIKALFKNAKPGNRSEAEVLGYKAVLSRIHQKPLRLRLTPESILDFHKEMFRLTDEPVGHFKRRDNTIEERLPDGSWKTRFVPVSARQTPAFVKETCRRYHDLAEDGQIPDVVRVAALVLDFLCIHPFRDGNGRLSRLLTTLLLYQNDYDVGRYVALEKIVEDRKEQYYDVLQRSSKNWHLGKHDIRPWTEFFIVTLVEAYKQFETQLGKLQRRRGNKTVLVEQSVRELPLQFTLADVEAACPHVSHDMIRVVLNGMRKEKKVRCLGTGRAARWERKNRQGWDKI